VWAPGQVWSLSLEDKSLSLLRIQPLLLRRPICILSTFQLCYLGSYRISFAPIGLFVCVLQDHIQNVTLFLRLMNRYVLRKCQSYSCISASRPNRFTPRKRAQCLLNRRLGDSQTCVQFGEIMKFGAPDENSRNFPESFQGVGKELCVCMYVDRCAFCARVSIGVLYVHACQ
jgi:hypothetical protein